MFNEIEYDNKQKSLTMIANSKIIEAQPAPFPLQSSPQVDLTSQKEHLNIKSEKNLQISQELYSLKLRQFYRQVESWKKKSKSKRIKPNIVQILFFIASQILIILFKYHILNNDSKDHFSQLLTQVQLFSIASFCSFIYFIFIYTFRLGFLQLVKHQIHLDTSQLLLIVAAIMSQYFIIVLDLNSQHNIAFRMAYLSWIFYLSSTIRIQVSLYKLKKIETILLKLVVLVQFIASLATFSRFIGNHIYIKESQNYKQISYLYYFSHLLMIASFYRLFSAFDGTNRFRSDFVFQNSLQAKLRSQIQALKEKLIVMKK